MENDRRREGEIIKKVAEEFFSQFDTTELLGDIDFAVKLKRPKSVIDFNDEYLLWAEAKKEEKDIVKMLAQLILTIGKARTFDKIMPPAFLGCFDSKKIAFIPYFEIQNIFYQNDFNWKVAPNDTTTKEFQQIVNQITKLFDNDVPFEKYIFEFEQDKTDLKRFIRENFIVGKSDTTKIKIDKNNFIIIYNKWPETVKPTIAVNWESVKKSGLIDGDFYLADLLSGEHQTIPEKLNVLLKTNYYVANRHIDEYGLFTENQIKFLDKQKAYHQFWAKYERPPLEDYWNYMIDRHDLLVPQDIRERQGSFYTPRIWVEKSQEYLTKTFGEDWQDEYYIWDCSAGTGNLLVGLTNKYNIWASTLYKADVDIMHERINSGANLLDSHVFQFDFLNDGFDKLPEGLRDIINDEKRRKNLLIYINPPYAEADNRRGEKRTGVAETAIQKKYSALMGYTKRELYIQFLTRIYIEISGCKIGEFSKLKALQSPRFSDFRKFFKAKLKTVFIVPADSFDNVKGQFPIGFKIWDTSIKAEFKHIKADAFSFPENKFICKKEICNYDGIKLINDWVKTFRNSGIGSIATIIGVGSDFQNQRLVRFGEPNMKVPADNHNWQITVSNLIESAIYFTVRKIISATWLNDRDQFLFPNKKWAKDTEFQNDCLAYTLFSNNISSQHGINHWIPFREEEIEAQTEYKSHILIGFLSGKKIKNAYTDLFGQQEKQLIKREFSLEAVAVFNAGRELWKYYHKQKNINVNASLYDIREYFQGRNDKGKMNNISIDEKYNDLIGDLRDKLKLLAQKIEPKVYEYEFLKA